MIDVPGSRNRRGGTSLTSVARALARVSGTDRLLGTRAPTTMPRPRQRIDPEFPWTPGPTVTVEQLLQRPDMQNLLYAALVEITDEDLEAAGLCEYGDGLDVPAALGEDADRASRAATSVPQTIPTPAEVAATLAAVGMTTTMGGGHAPCPGTATRPLEVR